MKKSCFSFPTPTIITPIATEEALSDLPDNSVADGEAYPMSAQCAYQQMMRRGVETLHNHQATIHTKQTARIISMVPDGGNYKDLPNELQQTRK